MTTDTMPTLDSANPELDAVGGPESMLATHHNGKEPFDERFRRAKLRREMFGDGGPDLVIGRYVVEDRLGAGAMGTVYLALDNALERKVAIKVLHRGDEENRARMQIEAKALAKLSHPNVVTVHEVDTQDGQLFVAMEYVPGRTLTKWLLEAGDSSDVMDVFEQAARGLQAAHDAGVVHRDFKPDNVLVGTDRRVRVLDFGLARSAGTTLTDAVDDTGEAFTPDEPTITRTGVLAGTPGYMAPEQFLGARVDARTDQFAFCVALHEAVWGSRPFSGETLGELASAVLTGSATKFEGPPRRGFDDHVLAGIKAVVERGLASRPEDRFASMNELVRQLRSVLTPAVPKGRRSMPVKAALTGGLVAMSLGVTLVLFRGANPPTPEVPVPATAAAAVALDCAAGTYEDGDRCSPLPWSPSLVQCTEQSCGVPRWIARRMVEEAAFRSQHGRFIPLQDDGVVVGYKLFGARAGNLLGVLGFEPGDVVVRLGDVSLATDRGKAERLLSELDSIDTLDVVFTRKGTQMTRTIALTGRGPLD